MHIFATLNVLHHNLILCTPSFTKVTTFHTDKNQNVYPNLMPLDFDGIWYETIEFIPAAHNRISGSLLAVL